MTLGSLVRSTDNTLGIGKLITVEQPFATVEYFSTLGQPITQTLPISSLRRVKLYRQTRCYLYQEETETWQMGRIYAWDEERQQYQLDLPHSHTIFASEKQIYVRCNQPIEDPIHILAIKGQETPYFHSLRTPLLKTIIEQRAISRGMTGLLSANIELFPHQVEVIRRVLEDPIQRYLLADEVGLGKTIEAGAILRQFLLDEPTEKALVIVPPSLYYQWQQELESKFYLSHFGARVRLISTEDSKNLDILSDNYHFLIIDEAHHIAAMATSEDLVKRSYFEICRKLAHQAEKLLLLSATPVLHHEQDFLAMLHLLDPTSYQLDDIDGFRERIEKRQEIGRVLLSFKEGIGGFPLKKTVNKLKTLFREDKTLLTLIDGLQTSMQVKDENIQVKDEEAINQQIRVIRTYISDTYRLHRRMLRNRRATVEDVIFDRNALPKLEYDLDERMYAIHELLDEWRIIAPHDVNYQRIFSLLFCSSNTWLGVLKQVVETRLKGILNTSLIDDCSMIMSSESLDKTESNQSDDIIHSLIKDIGEKEYKILLATPSFEGEINILKSILEILNSPSEDGDRLELLNLIIFYNLADILDLQSFKSNLEKLEYRVKQRINRPFSEDKFPKLIIFTSFTLTCTAIVNYLVEKFGKDTVVSHQVGDSKETIETNLTKFKNEPRCFILVADKSGEEGKNLQFVDGVIHFDLPFSPNQLEQRLGRIDRIGGKMKVNSWLLAGIDTSNSLSDAWYQLLNEGFNIFNQSIASLQFYIDVKLSKIEEILFKVGTDGIKKSISLIKEEIEQETIKISEQNALDEIDNRSQTALNYFNILESYDDQHQTIEKVVEGWLCKALRFKQVYDTNLYDVRTYKPTEKTLVSATELKTYFAGKTQFKGVYNRRLANKYQGVHFYRIGQPLMDTLTNYFNWDDRGKAFAMWRKDTTWDSSEGGEWLGFRFDYLIEINWQEINSVLKEFTPSQINEKSLKYPHVNEKALKRQGDALFPPQVETIFLDQYFEPVEDDKLLRILQRSYCRKGGENRDYNLAKNRLSLLDEFIDSSQWPNFCHQARKQSENLLRESSYFVKMCQKQTISAKVKLMNRLHQLQSRYSRFPQPKLWDELQLETALNEAFVKAISTPSLKLDAVGFMIVSGRSPVNSNDIENET
ncbi:protein DpdE [Crocosphaera sp. XPORK-15E]|uniref:protein DpdE n=1 Tax=Crocosphaera sp. XPORK-15E TaxID=3110247 RepID=UPI002B1F6909|nr:protein DpdE [Crocosphaera sp. XPORK-15E]MEA5536675.1 protein DpdE [Crocosphaera sp. XPORK-15E]